MFLKPQDHAVFWDHRPGIRVLHDSDDARVVVFGLRPGQVVEPHSSSSTVLLQVLSGQGRLRVGETEQPAGPGDLAICPPNVLHGMAADTEMVVLAVIAPAPDVQSRCNPPCLAAEEEPQIKNRRCPRRIGGTCGRRRPARPASGGGRVRG